MNNSDKKKTMKKGNASTDVRVVAETVAARQVKGNKSSTSSSSKRTKHTAGGQYSSSEGGEGNASQEVEFPTSDAGRYHRRPQGNKAARARAGRGRGESSQAVSQGTPPPSLISLYFTATMADTSRMLPEQYEAHFAGIEYMARQLGICIPPQTGAPPPPSGDDSPRS
ncbi:uncharacterized protein LOC125219945 isoform X2 [Salvia hispanica]|uniref:uncharacterized protein LOC125219945 isoform X2 n=1 Tax=Salvia hispanica TaxID=49212 RepID=UPI002009BEB5|nr:uncharacterized protein LOC125219945 isoform X2 [Salvia hispanica]